MSDTQPTTTDQSPTFSNDRPSLHPEWIDAHASGIVKALYKAGHKSYLVGGCVRDLLLGIIPKDFDIVTMAHPPQVKRLIHMAFIIGKRFRLVLVKRGDQQFEVATFRREFDPAEFPAEEYPDGPPSADNIFGTPEQDAIRRDFTINALFYDPMSQELIDYVGGRIDIENRTLRMIGDPDRRLVEDPIRILRAIRFAHKLKFVIEPALRASMARHAGELKKSVLPRRREELLKLLRLEQPAEVLVECHDLGILREVYPCIEQMFVNPLRQECFLLYLETFKGIVSDLTNTGQVFSWLMASITETLGEEGVKLSEQDLNTLMRDELGMYKFEQVLVLEALKLRRILEKTEEHRRRGERRQFGIVRREGFHLALKLAAADLRLSGPDLLFWLETSEKLRPEIETERHQRDEKSHGRKSRGRRRSGSKRESNRLDEDLDSAGLEDAPNRAVELTREVSRPTQIETNETESNVDSSSR